MTHPIEGVQFYTKRPVTVQAIHYDGTNLNFLRAFVGDAFVFTVDSPAIETLEGTMAVNAGDYVIRGVKGEFYPCKRDIFEATYDRASLAECFTPEPIAADLGD